MDNQQHLHCTLPVILCLAFVYLGLLSPLNVLAQPFELHSSEFPPIGTVLSYDRVDNFSAIDTAFGQGVTWDWSSLITDSIPNHTESVIAPNSAPFISQFPACNRSVFFSGTVNAHLYFELSPTSYVSLGRNLGASVDIYPVPLRYLDLPLVYGVQSSTQFNTSPIFSGTLHSECVGSGTLIIPSGSYNDVLLVRKFHDFDLGDPVILYEWYDCDSGKLLLTISFFGNGTSSAGVLVEPISLGIEPIEQPAFSVDIVTPTNTSLDIFYQSAERIEASIYTATGQFLSTDVLPANSSRTRESIDLADLSEGVYLLNLWCESTHQTISKRFIKLRD